VYPRIRITFNRSKNIKIFLNDYARPGKAKLFPMSGFTLEANQREVRNSLTYIPGTQSKDQAIIITGIH